MECPTCLLRFHYQKRIPHILSCGHSLCSECLEEGELCNLCQSLILKNSKINYSLLEVIKREAKDIDKFVKVCFIGSSGGGKTSIIRMLTDERFIEEISSTIGFDFTFKDKKMDNNLIRFQFWDSAGQERYQAISPIHYKNANIVILVYDVNEREEVNKLPYWFSEIEKHAPKDVKKIIIGNKVDLLAGKISNPLQKQIWDEVRDGRVDYWQISCKNESGLDNLWFLLKKNSFQHKESLEKPKRNEVFEQKMTKQIQYVQLIKGKKNKKMKKSIQCC